jgi:hypothetical protein
MSTGSEEPIGPRPPTTEADETLNSAIPAPEPGQLAPGVPGLKMLAPSLIGGALVPLLVYNLVRHHVSRDVDALAIAGVPAAMWVAFEWLRRRRLDPIGAAVLIGFAGGVATSFALGGDAFVLKVRDSFLTSLCGLGCLLSLRRGKPLMFYLGRALTTRGDEERGAAYNELWSVEAARRAFATITAIWGIGFIVDAAGRVLLAIQLPTGTFIGVAPAVSAAVFAFLFVVTVRVSRRAQQQAVPLPGPSAR